MRATPSSESRPFDGTPSITMTFTGSVTLSQIRPISASSTRPGMKKPDAPTAAYALALPSASLTTCAASSPCLKNTSVRALMKRSTPFCSAAWRMAAMRRACRARRLTLLGLEEFEAAIFDEGNIAPAEFDLDRVAVMRGAEQHRLPAQRDAVLAMVEHAVGDIPGLRCLVLDIDQEWPLRRSLGRI